MRTVLATSVLTAAWFAAAQDVITAGGETDYAPYESYDADGDPAGFNVDVLQAIGRKAGFEVRFELGPWQEQRERLQSGEVDVLGMFVSQERGADVDFAAPNVIVSHRIFVPAGRDPVDGLEDLAGRRVVVQRNAYSHERLRAVDAEMELILVGDERTGLLRLVREGHDAAVLTEHRARRVLEDEGLTGEVVSGPPVLPAEYAFALRPGDEALLARIDEGLARVKATGEFDRIYARWLTPLEEGYDVGPDGRGVAWLGAGAALALLLLATAAWAWRVRRSRLDEPPAQRELEHLRRHDPLTGLLNRPAFEAELADGAGGAGGGDASRMDALASFDIDQFRLLNETYGHSRGDQALRDIARLIQRLSASPDRSARLGNDEFAWLLRGTELPSARARCEVLLEQIRAYEFADSDARVRITASVGLVGSHGMEDPSALLQRADAASLAAREEGGDRVREWREDDTRMAERRGALRWIREIREALDEDRLAVYGQPIVPTDPEASGACAVEALVRLRTREGELVPAGRFMPAAERYGLASRIDDWVVKAVLAWLQRNPAWRDSLRHVHVNLSGRSLGDPAFLAALEEALVASRALLPSLCFEITETALIENLDTARDVMTRLHDLGCRFALDDFGIGHSSMRYLRRLPVDYLKIDGVFVRDMARDPEAAKLVGQIHRLGRTMGLGTIAEFVESSEIRSRLRGLGVQEVQGYAVGRPTPLDEAASACAQRTPSRGAFRPR